MGFTSGTAIVTAAEVAAILHEVSLTNLDDAADANATIAGLCAAATDFLIREVKKRGANPTKVSNLSDFKEVAARWVRATAFESMPQGDDENRVKAERDRAWCAKEVREIVIEEDSAGSDQATQGPRAPVVVNIDRGPNFSGGLDNLVPGAWPGTLWQNSPQ